MAIPREILGNEAWLIGALLLALVIGMVAARGRVIGRLVQLGLWGVMLWLLATMFGERSRIDPAFGRVAAWLHPDDQVVAGREVRVRMGDDGHFWVRATINGVSRRMLVDSGATVTALSAATARAAGVEVRQPLVPILLRTANGTITAQSGRITMLRFGTITARDLPVVVSGAFGDTDVIGMNLLSKLKSWRVEDGRLILVPHHPQPPARPAAA